MIIKTFAQEYLEILFSPYQCIGIWKFSNQGSANSGLPKLYNNKHVKPVLTKDFCTNALTSLISGADLDQFSYIVQFETFTLNQMLTFPLNQKKNN